MSRDSIRARVAAATEGPWSWDDDPDLTQDSVWADDGDLVASTYGSTAKGSTDADDARFIANARQDIPALLRLADAVRADIDACAACVVDPFGWCDRHERYGDLMAALEALP